MNDKPSWFLPGLGWKTYIQKYPFVFIFSFITAFCWVLKADTPWAFSYPSAYLTNMGHFEPWAYCCLLGIPLFVLIHLLLNSPRLKNFKFHTTVILLGWSVLLGLFFAMGDGSNWMWSDFFQPFLIVTLAAFLWPLAGWNLSKDKTNAYFLNALRGLLKACVVFFLASGLFICIASIVVGLMNGQFSSLLHNRHVYGAPDVIGLSYKIFSPLIFPWYILGGLLKDLDRDGRSPAVSFGARTTVSALALLAVSLTLEGFKVFKQWTIHQSIFFLDEKIVLFLFALLSIGMVKAQKGKAWEKRRMIFTRIISVICIALILFSGLYCTEISWGGAGKAFYYSLVYVVWLVGCFVYFFLCRDTNWVKPVLLLWLLLIITCGGPLSPQYLSIKSHEWWLKNTLAQDGLLKEGLLVKAAPDMPGNQAHAILWNLQEISREDGLNWLRGAFPPELSQLDWSKTNGPANLPRLIEWLGLSSIQTRNNFSQFRQFSSRNDRNQSQWIGQYQLINFRFNQGDRGMTGNSPEYFMSFPAPGQSLNLFYRGKLIAVIPLDSFAKQLSQYSGNAFVISHIPPKGMALEYKNKAVEINIGFENVNSMVADGKLVIQGGNGTMLVRRLVK